MIKILLLFNSIKFCISFIRAEEKMIDVAIMGHGVVGSGVAEILINHKDRISNRLK